MSATGILAALAITALSIPIFQGNAKQESMNRGKEIYTQLCIVCHQADGKGLEGAFPPLANSDYLLKSPDKAIHAVKFGLQGPITVNGKEYNSIMTNQNLSDEEIADVLNYVMNTWGNTHEMITVDRVKKVVE